MKAVMIAAAMAASVFSAVANQQTPVAYSGHDLFYIWTGAGGLSQQQRLAIYNHRLIGVLGQTNLVPADVSVRRAGDLREIRVRDRLLATATPEDARAYGWSVDQVARHWRDSVAACISDVGLLRRQVGPSK